MTIGIMEVNLVDARGLKKSDFLFMILVNHIQNRSICIDPIQESRAQEHHCQRAEMERKVHIQGRISDKQPKLVLKIMDHDTFSSDDNIGQTTIYLKELLNQGVENGTSELPPQKCRVVDSNQNYRGDIRVGITFTPRVDSETYAQDFGGWKGSRW